MRFGSVSSVIFGFFSAVLVTATLAFSIVASAAQTQAECGAVDLSAKFGPSRNQDGVGWCAAFVAADLVSYKLGMEVSASDMAISHFETRPASMMPKAMSGRSAYSIRDVLWDSQKYGVCAEAKFRSRDNGANKLKKLLDDAQGISMGKKPACSKDLISLHQLWPTMSLQQANYAVLNSNSDLFFRRARAQACMPRNRTSYTVKSLRHISSFKEDRVKAVDDVLRSQRPVAIGISSKVLMNAKDPGTTADHAVIVIGRRFNAQAKPARCEYLIRNSWGNLCSSYAWPCSKDGKGHLWISSEALTRTIGTETTSVQ